MHFQSLARGEIGVDVQLLRNNADIGPRLARVFVDIGSPDPYRAGGFDHRSRHDVDEGRFAGPVRPQKPEDGTRRNVEVETLQRLFRSAAARPGIGLGDTARGDGDAVGSDYDGCDGVANAEDGTTRADNGADVDGDTLSIVDGSVSSPNGTITVNDDGNYVFTPTEHFFGSTQISFTITDDLMM